jgi:hypothetical protein
MLLLLGILHRAFGLPVELPTSVYYVVVGLLFMALAGSMFIDRDLALEFYWKGAPNRPSDRTILMIVRTICVGLMILGGWSFAVGFHRLLSPP